jgi:hypothetical protein
MIKDNVNDDGKDVAKRNDTDNDSNNINTTGDYPFVYDEVNKVDELINGNMQVNNSKDTDNKIISIKLSDIKEDIGNFRLGSGDTSKYYDSHKGIIIDQGKVHNIAVAKAITYGIHAGIIIDYSKLHTGKIPKSVSDNIMRKDITDITLTNISQDTKAKILKDIEKLNIVAEFKTTNLNDYNMDSLNDFAEKHKMDELVAGKHIKGTEIFDGTEAIKAALNTRAKNSLVNYFPVRDTILLKVEASLPAIHMVKCDHPVQVMNAIGTHYQTNYEIKADLFVAGISNDMLQNGGLKLGDKVDIKSANMLLYRPMVTHEVDPIAFLKEFQKRNSSLYAAATHANNEKISKAVIAGKIKDTDVLNVNTMVTITFYAVTEFHNISGVYL